ncbi:hypothetical protein [Streptomyces sp. NBC_01614]|uniref:hypothetical protein n=1 Tax=Streptomyces sp. NBC_01614 TaxID=2975897 RepID=UPI00386A88A6
MMTDEPRLDAKIIDYWGPVCDSGRHYPPHPGDTCDEADEWIRLRDQILADVMRQLWAQFTEPAMNRTRLAGTAFAAAAADPIPQPPDQPDVQRALDILGPHLAWDHRYRA